MDKFKDLFNAMVNSGEITLYGKNNEEQKYSLKSKSTKFIDPRYTNLFTCELISTLENSSTISILNENIKSFKFTQEKEDSFIEVKVYLNSDIKLETAIQALKDVFYVKITLHDRFGKVYTKIDSNLNFILSEFTFDYSENDILSKTVKYKLLSPNIQSL